MGWSTPAFRALNLVAPGADLREGRARAGPWSIGTVLGERREIEWSRSATPESVARRVAPGTTLRVVLIRRQDDADIAAVDAVHGAAFARPWVTGDPPEVALVRQLRAGTGWVPALSLVAHHADAGVVGHVVCTLGSIGRADALGLGPLGVLPAHQHRGAGQALVHAVLGAADALGYPAVALLGDPRYYARFGFVAASRVGVTAPEPTWGEHFQIRTLHGWHPDLAGAFRYAAPFDDLG